MWGFPENRHKKRTFLSKSSLVGDGGFEPPKALPADLQRRKAPINTCKFRNVPKCTLFYVY